MGSVSYYVPIAFQRDEGGELVALEPFEAHISIAAVSRTRSLAASEAGAVAFSRTGDPEAGEFADAVVLFTAGEGPEDIAAHH